VNASNKMRIQITELSDKQGLILDEADLELILGLASLMELDEELPAMYAPRVELIYKKALEISYG
jgi:hypothetical protein